MLPKISTRLKFAFETTLNGLFNTMPHFKCFQC